MRFTKAAIPPERHSRLDLLREEEPYPRLMLGTVQLGMPYGIANTSGQPDRATARQIIKTALDNNVTYFDTAQAYGDSEHVLGSILEELGASATVHIASKLSAQIDPSDTKGIEAAIEQSLSRLRISRLWCMLLHQPAWLAAWDTGLGDVLRRFQAEGRIAHLGVSLNTMNDAEAALAHPGMAVLQAPCNAWDQRMQTHGWLERARTQNRVCCIRSVYLQGLLTMTPEAAAARLPTAREASLRWWKLAGDFGMPPQELALRYALTLRAPLVIGAESPGQLAENARLANLPPLDSEEVRTIAAVMAPVLDEKILEPWRWKTQR